MLDIAIRYADQLQYRFQQTRLDERYKYFTRTAGFDYFLNLSDNTWENLQFVSIGDQSEVIGYLAVKVNRLTRTAYDMEAIKFVPGYSQIFSQDMGEFDLRLFNQFGIDRLVWSVVVGNPAEKFYDQLCNVCGVRIVGTFRNEVMLGDGQLYDLKFYEVMKDDFFRSIGQIGANVFNYRELSKEVET